jgi:trypsin
MRLMLVLAAVLPALVQSGVGRAVVGGSAVPAGKYPFMAAVLRDGSPDCGGSVIAQRWVLTAAHCVTTASIDVSVGNVDWTGGRRIHVDQAIRHPSYNGATNAYDVAVLHLVSDAGVAPITLNVEGPAGDALEADGAPVTVAGWGSNVPIVGLVRPVGTSLQEADLNVVGDDRCSDDNAPGLQVCAEHLLRDSCQGDSGGPLFATTPGGRVQIGVVSYGTGCAIPFFAGVYAEVNASGIRSFIRQRTGV